MSDYRKTCLIPIAGTNTTPKVLDIEFNDIKSQSKHYSATATSSECRAGAESGRNASVPLSNQTRLQICLSKDSKTFSKS